MADSHRRAASGHERQDLDLRWIAAAGLGIGLLLAVILASLWLVGGKTGGGPPRGAAPDALQATAPPLQLRPAADLATLRRRNLARLNSYGWVDRQAGIAHIPIERAMTIVAERGLPSFGREKNPPAREPVPKSPPPNGQPPR